MIALGHFLRISFLTVLFLSLGIVSFQNLQAQEGVYFEDRFEGNLQPGWQWLRGNPACRRFGRGLEIAAEPYANGEAHNVLMRPVTFPGRGFWGFETQMTFVDQPTNQYQQGGLYWRRDGRVVFKLVHEFIDGKLYIFPGKIPVNSPCVNLRIITDGDNIFAEYCGEGETDYRRIYEGRLEKGGNDEIALQCWNGPETPNSSWLRFSHFRIINMGAGK